MNTETNNCLAKCVGVAMVRWALGLLFLVGGVGKLLMLKGFVTGYLVPTFAKTILPVWLVTVYGYALPFVETILGLALLLGVCRTPVLIAAGFTLLTLAFGQMLIQGFAIVANIYVYVLMIAFALVFQKHDGYGIVCCKSKCEKTATEEASK